MKKKSSLIIFILLILFGSIQFGHCLISVVSWTRNYLNSFSLINLTIYFFKLKYDDKNITILVIDDLSANFGPSLSDAGFKVSYHFF
jgi:hypothetical protein